MNSTLRDLKNRRNKLMTDAAALVRQENVTDEHRSQADRMLADVDALDKDIAREERMSAFEEEQRAANAPARPRPSANTDREVEAFERYLRSGQADPALRERRDLTTGIGAGTPTPSGAGYLLPNGLASLAVARKFYGPLTTLVSSLNTGHANPIKLPTWNDVANTGTVIDEATASSELDPTVGGNGVSGWSYCSWVDLGTVRVSIPEARDSAFPLSDLIASSFAERYYRTATKYITNGTADGFNQSIVSTATNVVTTALQTAIAYPELAELFSSCDPSYSANGTFMLHNNTLGNLLGVTTTIGSPLYIPAPSAEAFDTLFGRRVVMNPYMPQIAAGNTTVVFGDFKSGYLWREGGGMIVRRTDDLYLASGEIGYVAFASLGGVSRDAGTHPIVSLTQHS